MSAAANVPVWDDAPWAGFAPLDRDVAADACVVGLGGTGLAAVEALLAQGRSVVAIDAGVVAGGAAGRNGGLLLAGLAEFHHDAVERWGAAVATEAYQLTLEEIARRRLADGDDAWWPGSLRIATAEDEEADCGIQYEQMKADGLPVAWYDGAEGRGLLFPEDGAFHPMRRHRRLAQRLAAAGAQLHEGTRAVAFEPGVVRTASGARITADHVFACLDGRLVEAFPQFAPHARTVRLQMLATAPAGDVRIPRPVYANNAFDYWQQLPDGRVALGGGRDRFLARENTADDTPTPDIQAHLDRLLRETIGTQAPVTHRWAASVCYTDDQLPVVAEVHPGTWAIGAYSGTGNLVGPLCARGAVRRALGGRDRFTELLASAKGGGTPARA